ncbi:MAG: hypothetical protein P1U29_03180 [Candidatus Pelagibacter bacterium]|jgi:hypothetical protein|nr:hypothetical protein [Vicingaceae bacterium]MDF1857951.1 hypothetical protein [Candidatus Pelagibacter bacterium]|tara:strand:- start:1789 stop:2067 length:279 start_codon:yes stop_codon:yes gene_type:complete
MAGARRNTSITVSNEDITWIKDQLIQQHTVLTKINQTIIGDKEYGQKGLVEQVNEHRKYIHSDQKLKAKFVGGTTVVGVVWTLLLKFWDKIF